VTHFDSYLICATPRTGSSLLLGLLDSTGIAGHPEAYFRDPDEAGWAARWRLDRSCAYAEFVRAARVAGSTPNGVFGAKLMWGTLDEVVAKLGRGGQRDLAVLERAFGRTRFLYLRRDDVVAQAVSRVRAEQTTTWYVGDAGSNGRPPAYDADQIAAFVDEIHEHNAAWEAWFDAEGITPHRVRYEDLDADNAGVTAGILAFLGLQLPPGHAIVPRHKRQADHVNREWIQRFRG
jgi:LPS sulfotransferase NodH